MESRAIDALIAREHSAVREEIAYARGVLEGMQLADAFRRGPACSQKKAQAIENLKAYIARLDECDGVHGAPTFNRVRRDRLCERLITNTMEM